MSTSRAAGDVVGVVCSTAGCVANFGVNYVGSHHSETCPLYTPPDPIWKVERDECSGRTLTCISCGRDLDGWHHTLCSVVKRKIGARRG